MPLSSASVHEAAGRIGALPSHIKPIDPSFCLDAPAFPVRCPPGDNLWLHRAVAAAPPGAVLVVSTGGAREYGYWGEILGAAAAYRGLAGLVIDGGVRDSHSLVRSGFPVFAARVCIRGTGKDPDAGGGMGEPVVIGAVEIGSGDLVVADADGVVVIPTALAPEVVGLAQERDRKEREILERIHSGESTSTIYDLPTELPGAPSVPTDGRSRA